ncbi:hypothetical protein HDV05_004787, partial [Chytridiales sp. JEL 0842]
MTGPAGADMGTGSTTSAQTGANRPRPPPIRTSSVTTVAVAETANSDAAQVSKSLSNQQGQQSGSNSDAFVKLWLRNQFGTTKWSVALRALQGLIAVGAMMEANGYNRICWSDLAAIKKAGIEGYDCVSMRFAVIFGFVTMILFLFTSLRDIVPIFFNVDATQYPSQTVTGKAASISRQASRPHSIVATQNQNNGANAIAGPLNPNSTGEVHPPPLSSYFEEDNNPKRQSALFSVAWRYVTTGQTEHPTHEARQNMIQRGSSHFTIPGRTEQLERADAAVASKAYQFTNGGSAKDVDESDSMTICEGGPEDPNSNSNNEDPTTTSPCGGSPTLPSRNKTATPPSSGLSIGGGAVMGARASVTGGRSAYSTSPTRQSSFPHRTESGVSVDAGGHHVHGDLRRSSVGGSSGSSARPSVNANVGGEVAPNEGGDGLGVPREEIKVTKSMVDVEM